MANSPKSVYFNPNNEKDKKILKHVARRNFSGYVKKLILADIEKKEAEKEIKKTPPIKKVMGKGIAKQIQPVKPFFPNEN